MKKVTKGINLCCPFYIRSVTMYSNECQNIMLHIFPVKREEHEITITVLFKDEYNKNLNKRGEIF